MKTKVAEFGALPEGQGLCVKAGGVSLVLIKSGGRVHALENNCPHLKMPLARGRIENGRIICPFHGSSFDIKTGKNVDWVGTVAGHTMPLWARALFAMGRKPKPVKTFPVSIENGAVFVEL